MARKEKHDKLLNKYLLLGLRVIGSNTHKDREHWILLGDVNVCYSKLKLSFLSRLIVISKRLTFN